MTPIPTASPTTTSTQEEWLVSQKAASPLAIFLGIVCVSLFVLVIVVRTLATLIIHGRVAEAEDALIAAEHAGEDQQRRKDQAAAALHRARALERRFAKGRNNPASALLVAALQSVSALGDISAVSRAAPALGVLAEAMQWTELQFPLPVALQQKWFPASAGVTEEVEALMTSLYWVAAIVGGLLAVHVPSLLFVRARVVDAIVDEVRRQLRALSPRCPDSHWHFPAPCS